MRLMRSVYDATTGRSGAANLTCLTRQSKSTTSLPKNVLKRVSRACECRVRAWKIKEEKNNKSWSWIRMNESDLGYGRILGQGIN